MTDEKKPSDPKPVADDKVAPTHKITRRRLTKAGAVAPIVMTLAGRPVWGQDPANGSAAASFSATSEMALSQTVTQVSSPPERWLSAALTGAWPTSNEFPGFTVASGDAFDRLFPVPSLHKCARKDVDLLRGQRLVSVLGGTIGLNEKLSLLAKQAIAAKLNSLLGESLASKLGLTRELFPMKPQAVVDGFWDAVQLDCTSISAISLRTTSTEGKPSAKSTNCTAYDQGVAMASLAGQLEDLNASGTSLL